MAVLISIVGSYGLLFGPQAIGSDEDRIDYSSGVRITSSIESSAIPELWRREPISAELMPLASERWDLASRAIASALRKYPPEIVRQVLTNVYVVNEMFFYGIPRDGTYHNSSIFVRCGPIWINAHDIERTFHHEMSSLFLRSKPEYLDFSAWRALNPHGFKYRQEVDGAPERVPSRPIQTERLEQGFLSPNSTFSLEDDFNMLAEHLFSYDPELWSVCSKNEVIEKKLMLVIGVYRLWSPLFSREYFQSKAKISLQ